MGTYLHSVNKRKKASSNSWIYPYNALVIISI